MSKQKILYAQTKSHCLKIIDQVLPFTVQPSSSSIIVLHRIRVAVNSRLERSARLKQQLQCPSPEAFPLALPSFPCSLDLQTSLMAFHFNNKISISKDLDQAPLKYLSRTRSIW